MSDMLTLRVDPAASPTTAASVASTLATLPESFGSAGAGSADVVVIEGGAGWAERSLTAAEEGARALLVLAPTHASDDELVALIARGVPVVLDVPWRHDEAVRRAAAHVQRIAAAGSLLEARATVASPADLPDATRALALTAAALLGSPLVELTPIVDARQHAMLMGRSATGVRLVASAVVAPHPAGRSTFRLIVGARAVHVAVPSPESASPGRASITGPDGRDDIPVVFGSGRRTAMRLARDAAHGRIHPTDLDDLRALLAAAPQPASGSQRLP